MNNNNLKGESLLHYGCFYGMIDKYYALINMGINPKLTYDGNSLLHYASYSGNDNFLIVELVKSGVLPIEKNNYGQTSVHYCANKQIAHYLNLWCIRNNINILNLLDKENNNIAHGCMQSGHIDAAMYWISNYPKLDKELNVHGKTWKETKSTFLKYCEWSNI